MSNTPEPKTHWAADIFPLNESDIDAIAEDIDKHGQQVPILMLKDGRILDGRNRWYACQEAGVEPVVEILNEDGREVTDEEALERSISLNGKRRSLTPGQRACAAAEVIDKLEPQQGRGKKGSKRTAIRGSFSAGDRATDQALTLLRNDPELFATVKGGEFTINTVYERFLELKAEKEALDAERELIRSFPDIDRRYDDDQLSHNEALTLAKLADEEAQAAAEIAEEQERERRASIERKRAAVSAAIAEMADRGSAWFEEEAEYLADCYDPSDYSPIYADTPIYEGLTRMASKLQAIINELTQSNE